MINVNSFSYSRSSDSSPDFQRLMPAHTLSKREQSVMATEVQLHEGPSSSSAAAAAPLSGAIAVAATATTPGTAIIAPIPSPVGPTVENAGTAPPKRQRRPSVRLGEIGDQPATLAYESHARRPKTSWRLSRDPSKPHKARSLTHIANGNNNTEHSNLELGLRKSKTKRSAGGSGTGTVGIATKRVRSNWGHYKADDIAENSTREGEFEGEEDEVEEEEEEDHEEAADDVVYGREFDPGSESPMNNIKDSSPVHSADYVAAIDSRDQKGGGGGGASTSGSDGVRSWLMELGLSRYAPVFEIHEVDDEVLAMLTLDDLKDMGINAVGSRRKIFAAIQKLRRGFS